MKLPLVGRHTIAEINRFPRLGLGDGGEGRGGWREVCFQLGLPLVRGCVQDLPGVGGVCRIGAPTCKNVWTGCYEHRFSIAVEAKRRGLGGRGGYCF